LKDVPEDVIINKLTQTYDFLISIPDCRMSFEYDYIRVYTNTLDCVEQATELSENHIQITEAIPAIPSDSIICKNSNYKFRIYFRHIKVSQLKRKNIASFVRMYKEHIHISESLEYWVLYKGFNGSSNWHTRTRCHYFIDIMDLEFVKLFDIMAPGVKSKVYKIITDK